MNTSNERDAADSAAAPLPAPDRPAHADRLWLGTLVITLLVLAAYFPALRGEFLWDDDMYVSANAMIPAADGLLRIWTTTESPQYYPLVFTTFWLEYRLWRLDTLGYHLVNLALHAACAVLLWRVLRALGIPGCWFAAVLFALHPVNVESVAWITERKNVLSGAFALLSVLLYLRYDRSARPAALAASLLLFAAALLSKTTTVMVPPVLALCLWHRRTLWQRRNLLALIPFFVMSAVMAAVTIWYERHHVGAKGDEWDVVLLERVCLSGHIVWFYLGKLLVPLNLSFVYPRWRPDPHLIASWLPLLAALAAALAILLACRLPGRRALILGLGSYAVCLFPVLGFFDVYFMRYASCADHFAYLPAMCAIPLFVAAALRAIGSRWHYSLYADDRNPIRARRVLAVVVLAVAGVLTHQRTYIFRNVETLWTDTLARNPDAWIAHNNLGNVYLRRGLYEQAIPYYRATLRLNPRLTEAHDNYRLALLMLDRWRDAIDITDIATKTARDNVRPILELARMLAACPLPDLRDCDKAAFMADKVIEAAQTLNRPVGEPYDVLAAALACRGNFDQAIEAARIAVQLGEQQRDPRRAEYRQRLDLYMRGQPWIMSKPVNPFLKTDADE